jgi:hypothetical protein
VGVEVGWLAEDRRKRGAHQTDLEASAGGLRSSNRAVTSRVRSVAVVAHMQESSG